MVEIDYSNAYWEWKRQQMAVSGPEPESSVAERNKATDPQRPAAEEQQSNTTQPGSLAVPAAEPTQEDFDRATDSEVEKINRKRRGGNGGEK